MSIQQRLDKHNKIYIMIFIRVFVISVSFCGRMMCGVFSEWML